VTIAHEVALLRVWHALREPRTYLLLGAHLASAAVALLCLRPHWLAGGWAFAYAAPPTSHNGLRYRAAGCR
jgi:hypothetical protein